MPYIFHSHWWYWYYDFISITPFSSFSATLLSPPCAFQSPPLFSFRHFTLIIMLARSPLIPDTPYFFAIIFFIDTLSIWAISFDIRLHYCQRHSMPFSYSDDAAIFSRRHFAISYSPRQRHHRATHRAIDMPRCQLFQIAGDFIDAILFDYWCFRARYADIFISTFWCRLFRHAITLDYYSAIFWATAISASCRISA